jgi:hypothetical protein
MQNLIDGFRDRQEASASQAPPMLEERRAAVAPGGRLHLVPDDVLVKDVTAGRGQPTDLPPHGGGRRPGAPVPARHPGVRSVP